MHLLAEAEFWVAIAFAIFLGVLAYVGAHRMIIDALDSRAARISSELEEARRLRDEAAKLLAEAGAIITEAKAEAERVAAESKVKMEEFVARRTKLAESKIGQAEAQALADVRAAAADAAIAAAETILRDTAKGQVADNLIARGIADVKAKLN
jgi:F-type H+-transporting ATPase subunit b